MAIFSKLSGLPWNMRIAQEKTGSPTPEFKRWFDNLFGNSEFLNSDSGVTPGNYTNANITVDARGRVTAAANGAGGSGSFAFDGGAAIGGRGFVLDGGTSAALTDLDFWIDGGTA